MGNRILVLILKELHAVMLDKKSRAQLLIAPFIMLFVFSFAVTMEVKNASLCVLNHDKGDFGRQFAARFSSGTTFTRVVEVRNLREMRSAVENQTALMALQIPEDFSARLISGRPVVVQAVLDGRKTNAAQIANGIALSIARDFGHDTARPDTRGAPAVGIVTRQLFNPNLDYLWFTLPVLLVLLTQMISLIVSGLSIARERELGTFEQLRVSPLSPFEIVVGKAAPAVGLAFCEGVIIHLIAVNLFGIPCVGNLALLAFSFFLFILAVTGVGLFISSLCGTQQQAFLGCFLYMVPAVLLSGFAAPVENMPGGLQSFTLLNPARHIINVALGLYLKGTPLAGVARELLWLAGIAAVTLVFAGAFFRRRAGP